MDIPCVDTPKRSGDVCRGGIRQRNCTIAACNGHSALNVSCGDTAEAIANLKCALYIRYLHRAVVIAHDGIPCGSGELDAAKCVGPPPGTGVADGYRAIAILYIRGSVNTCYFDASETVSHRDRCVGRHPNVIANGP